MKIQKELQEEKRKESREEAYVESREAVERQEDGDEFGTVLWRQLQENDQGPKRKERNVVSNRDRTGRRETSKRFQKHKRFNPKVRSSVTIVVTEVTTRRTNKNRPGKKRPGKAHPES